jgi:hypothetical protein
VPEERIAALGVQVNGAPAVPRVSFGDLARMASADVEGRPQPGTQREAPPAVRLSLIRQLINHLREWQLTKHLGDIDDLTPDLLRNPRDPRVRWGIVYHQAVPQDVRAELEVLRKHRNGSLLPDWEPIHTPITWLGAQGINLINRDTAALPYYLLLVGGPDQIPFEYQYELARIRAVGRLDLGPREEPYRAYVESVRSQEERPSPARRALFTAARTRGDESTELSATHLIPALGRLPDLRELDYHVDPPLTVVRCDELKAALRPDPQGRTAALAFVATHGVSFPPGDARQPGEQGGWVCSDWQGGAVQRHDYLAGTDVGEGFCAPGSIVFALACFGAGTSRQSEYARYYNALSPHQPLSENVAPAPFSASLARAFLAHRDGRGQAAGALAYVGHVDLSWSSAFWDPLRRKADVSVFETFVQRVLRGDSVGTAAHAFTRLVDDCNAKLTGLTGAGGILDIRNSAAVGGAWIDRNNARGFIVLGDPAVRLDLAKLA